MINCVRFNTVWGLMQLALKGCSVLDTSTAVPSVTHETGDDGTIKLTISVVVLISSFTTQ